MMGSAFERLTFLKEYRTPRAFRSFARVYVLCIGALYGPHYLTLALGTDQQQENIALALVYACAVQLVVSGLFSVMRGLEDPFARRGGRGVLDSVRTAEIIEVARQQLAIIERESAVPWMEHLDDHMSTDVS
mmetsp:Transcript_49589/g.82320  ORF Transcript_49589/g.82320 Transcript_49589/m.82320 type:complete len:132 (+) Transcript_49589:2-397(+)